MASNSITPPAGFVLEQNPAPQQQPKATDAATAKLPQNGSVTPPAGFVLEQPQAQPTNDQSTKEDRGFLSGAWDSTVGGIVNLAKQASDYYQNHPKTKYADALSPAAMLVDAAKDPDHPVHKLVSGIVNSHIETGRKAYQKAQEAVAAVKRGDITEANRALSEAEGYGIGALLPILGPAAAKAGEDIGKEPLYGSGEAAGLIASVLAPEAIRGLKAKPAEVAGVEVPVRASKNVSSFDLERTQPAARRAMANVASDVEGRAISNHSLPEQAADLSERAEQIRAQSKPVFEKLDELTKGEEETFSDLQRKERYARARKDFETADQARAKQDAIFERFKSEFSPDDYTNARANWRQASALDKVHDAIGSATQPTPAEFRQKGVPDTGYVNGKLLSKRILKLRQDGTLNEAGLSAQGVQDLQDLGTLLEKTKNVPWTSRTLSYLATNPQVLSIAVQALKSAPYAAQAGNELSH